MTDAARPNETREPIRSPELLSAENSRLLIVDVQEKLLPLIPVAERLTHNCRRLLDGAKILSVPRFGTEQYPQGLGRTTPQLAERLGPLPSKVAFSWSPFSNGARRHRSPTTVIRWWSPEWKHTSACCRRCSI